MSSSPTIPAALLVRLAEVAARFIEVPRPLIDESLPSAGYVAAHERAGKLFTELQRERAIRLAGHMEWLAREDDVPLGQRIAMVTKIMTDDLAKPLPYPAGAQS